MADAPNCLLFNDMAEKAAAYHFDLCANYPFIDWNKRVAVAASEVFLLVNGFELGASDDDLKEIRSRWPVADCPKSK